MRLWLGGVLCLPSRDTEQVAQCWTMASLHACLVCSSRLGQLVQWLDGGKGSPLIILDECHKVCSPR